MTNAEILSLMMARLGNRQATLMRAACLTELNIAIRELERESEKPWFLESVAEGTTVANQEYIEQPTDFLIETEEGTFELQNDTDGWVELSKLDRDAVRSVTANVDPAFPEVYYLWGKRIYFGPVPDLAYDYRFDYYKRTTPIVDNNAECTNDWLNEFLDLTVNKALIVVARDRIQSDRMTANFTAIFGVNYRDFQREVIARKEANRTRLLTNEES